MICVSIGERNFERCRQLLQQAPMAEIRADLCGLAPADIGRLVRSHPCTVLTCRLQHASEREAMAFVDAALENGVRYVDVETDAPQTYLSEVIRKVRSRKAGLILSYHHYTATPDRDTLLSIADGCLKKGADLVKIVTAATSLEEVSRVLQLYGSDLFRKAGSGRLVAFAMGEKVAFSRFLSLRLGAPFTYAAPDTDASETSLQTAPGQYTCSRLAALLTREKKPVARREAQGGAEIPSSKSLTQRALVAALLTEGESRLENYTACEDNEQAIRFLEKAGAQVLREAEDTLIVRSPGACALRNRLARGNGDSGEPVFHTGESALLTRLLMPLSAFLATDRIRIDGSGSLKRRDLSESIRSLRDAGIDCEGERYLPVGIRGPIRGSRLSICGRESSQLVSGFLMTLPLVSGTESLTVKEPTSVPYIRMTLNLLEKFGIGFEVTDRTAGKVRSLTFRKTARQDYRPARISLEGDWSSGAAFLVYYTLSGALHPGRSYTLHNLVPGSGQADEAILNVLAACGAEVKRTAERELTLTVGRTLRPFMFDATDCPDLFPSLAVLACFCCGTSRIRGVHRLFHKESDRAEAVYSELTVLGADLEFSADELVVHGADIRTRPLKGGDCLSHRDHRIVMSLAVAAQFTEGPVTLDETDSVRKSFPAFFETLQHS